MPESMRQRRSNGKYWKWSVTLLLLLVAPAFATASEQDLLVTPKALAQQLDNSNLRILDVRSAKDFDKGHIPGAIPVDVANWLKIMKSKNGFTNRKAWAKAIGELGIANSNRVVVYGGNLTSATRVWWTLKYLGLENVALLDGGWDLWSKQGLPTSKDQTKIETAKFVPKFQPDRLEIIDNLKKSTKNKTIVDTRSEKEFTGAVKRGPRGGHIPNAVHLEWTELLNKDGTFKSKENLKKLFQSRGIMPDSDAVCY